MTYESVFSRNKDSAEMADIVQVSNMPRVTTASVKSQNSKMGPD